MVCPLSPARCRLLPERPLGKETAAGYVMGSGLCKPVAGPGGTRGTEQHPLQPVLPAPSRNFWSKARLLLPLHSAFLLDRELRAGAGRARRCSGRDSGPGLGPSSLIVGRTPSRLWDSVSPGKLRSSLGALPVPGVLFLAPWRERSIFVGSDSLCLGPDVPLSASLVPDVRGRCGFWREGPGQLVPSSVLCSLIEC